MVSRPFADVHGRPRPAGRESMPPTPDRLSLYPAKRKGQSVRISDGEKPAGSPARNENQDTVGRDGDHGRVRHGVGRWTVRVHEAAVARNMGVRVVLVEVAVEDFGPTAGKGKAEGVVGVS